MEFDESRVYTALNAGKMKKGSKVVAADNMANLKKRVQELGSDPKWPKVLTKVNPEDHGCRFDAALPDGDTLSYALAYMVEEPDVPSLKWTDLKLGDAIREMDGDTWIVGPTIHCLVDMIDDDPNTVRHIHAGGKWISNDELKGFVKEE